MLAKQRGNLHQWSLGTLFHTMLQLALRPLSLRFCCFLSVKREGSDARILACSFLSFSLTIIFNDKSSLIIGQLLQTIEDLELPS